MFLVSAEAKTSAFAPDFNCVTRSDEPAKLKVTFVPALADWNFSPMAVKVVFRDAAAKTVSVCVAVFAWPAG